MCSPSYSGNYAEIELNDLIEQLTLDRQSKVVYGTNLLEYEFKNKVCAYMDAIRREISAAYAEYVSFDVAVTSSLQYLNFFDNDFYMKQKKLMAAYGGMEFCDTPYYTFDN